MLGFAGGVRDRDGVRAFIPVAPNTVVAVDLTLGTVLWRRDGVGRPVAASSSRLVALAREGTKLVLRLFDAATGEETAKASDLGMPDWAAQTDTSADAVHVDASESDAGILIEWRLRRPYRGGAHPPARVMQQASDEAAGALLLDPTTAQTRIVEPPHRDAVRARAIESADLTPPASDDPTVVSLDRVGDRLFAVRVETIDGGSRVILEARDARDGATVWEATLAERPPTRPAPLRK
jgi:hypothetical protein